MITEIRVHKSNNYYFISQSSNGKVFVTSMVRKDRFKDEVRRIQHNSTYNPDTSPDWAKEKRCVLRRVQYKELTNIKEAHNG